MIELRNVSKTFPGGVTAVDNLSLTVAEGETFGLIGTSGCGKTTTLRMINRLDEPTSGAVYIDGEPAAERPPEVLRRRIGYVIQDVGLFPHYTVRENVTITPKLLQWDGKKITARSNELLELVGLSPYDFAARKPAALSGGQQQRVGLARALAADPPVILMDEPFGALDPITKERIQQEFKQLLREIQKTVVLVTHDVFEAFDLCGRLCLMDQGRARQTGTPRELLFNPADEFVESFFDNHRFQLEMMSITIEDIMEVLNESEALRSFSVVGDDDLYIQTDDSFFSVFESSHSNQRFTVINEEGESIGAITTDLLLEGFQQVRRNLREGHNE